MGNIINTSDTVIGALPSAKVSSTIKEVSHKTRKGFKFPITSYERGYFSTSTEVELAKSNLKQLLSTRPGERLMLPDFGCDLESLLFEPFDAELVLEAKERVVRSITRFIPYLKLNKVQVRRLDESTKFGVPVLLIQVSCQIRDDENTTFEVSLKV